MSGLGHFSVNVPFTGNSLIDGILAGSRWTDAVITYGFSSGTSVYGSNYAGNYDFLGTYSVMSAQQRYVVSAILDMDANDGAYAAFSFEGITGQSVAFSTSAAPHIRAANASDAPFGYGFFPAEGVQRAGDFWIGDDYAGSAWDARTPVQGNYSHMLHMHEIGHTLGLHHPHDADDLPLEFDAFEYTVMSYRSYVGGPLSYRGFGNDFPQSFMMLDIQALQHLYGANYDLNSGDTVYSWRPDAGHTIIDGQIAINPIINRIFATIWDGGGVDTFDLSFYAANLSINLTPGQSSQFSTLQTAFTGDGNYAAGNIYNALLFEEDTRSLIENAIGGSGDDMIIGNSADNHFTGGGGNDVLSGAAGEDVFIFSSGHGDDVITDFSASDAILAPLSPYLSMSRLLDMMSPVDGGVMIDFGLGGTVMIEGAAVDDFTLNNFILTGIPLDGTGPFRNDNFPSRSDKAANMQKPMDDGPVMFERFALANESPAALTLPEPYYPNPENAFTMSPTAHLDSDIIDYALYGALI